MIPVYCDADYEAVLKQKKRILAFIFAVTSVYLIFCIGCLIYYTTLPTFPEWQTLIPQVLVYVATGVYIIFMVPFVGIKLRRVRKYCKLLSTLSLGSKNVEENYFMGFYKKQLQKDDVDVISCVFRTWNKKNKDWTEREVYFDNEQEWPTLERGDYVRYVVQSNFLIQYEVLREGAMQEDIENGLIPKEMMEEDRPVFGKIYNVIIPDKKAVVEKAEPTPEEETPTEGIVKEEAVEENTTKEEGEQA